MRLGLCARARTLWVGLYGPRYRPLFFALAASPTAARLAPVVATNQRDDDLETGEDTGWAASRATRAVLERRLLDARF